MSQHYFEATHEGRPITIQMGWDAPLQGFYMLIEYTDVPEDEEYEYLYNNLEQAVSHPTSLELYLDVLKTHQIEIPEQMVWAINEDRIYSRVNNKQNWNRPL